MAYVTSHPVSMSMTEYELYQQTSFHTTTSESLKRSVLITETELPLEDDVLAIPRTLPVSSQLDMPVHNSRRTETTVMNPSTDVSLGPNFARAKDHDQAQDQRQEQLTLLASINEQTTSLLQTYSQSQSQSQAQSQSKSHSLPNSEDGDTEVLEQALVLGQIALVLASSLYRTVESQTQVLLALANMGTTLVKKFDRTGNEKDLAEAGVLYERAVVMGRGSKGKRESKLDTHLNGDGSGEVLVRLEKLGELLGKRGFVAKMLTNCGMVNGVTKRVNE